MKRHIDLLGILFIAYGAFQLLIGGALGLIYLGLGGAMGAAGFSGGDEELAVMGGILGASGGIVACAVGVFAIPTLVAGLGIRKRAAWGRILGLVTGALALTSIPFGTALGVFAFVVLLDAEVGGIFRGEVAE